MKLSLPDTVRDEIQGILRVFHDAGYECYLVGGSVRDLVLGHGSEDFDFATNARPEEVMRLFRRVAPTGIKHGTVSVLVRDKAYEITTYRADGKYIDGRRPESVSFSDSGISPSTALRMTLPPKRFWIMWAASMI